MNGKLFLCLSLRGHSFWVLAPNASWIVILFALYCNYNYFLTSTCLGISGLWKLFSFLHALCTKCVISIAGNDDEWQKCQLGAPGKGGRQSKELSFSAYPQYWNPIYHLATRVKESSSQQLLNRETSSSFPWAAGVIDTPGICQGMGWHARRILLFLSLRLTLGGPVQMAEKNTQQSYQTLFGFVPWVDIPYYLLPRVITLLAIFALSQCANKISHPPAPHCFVCFWGSGL